MCKNERDFRCSTYVCLCRNKSQVCCMYFSFQSSLFKVAERIIILTLGCLLNSSSLCLFRRECPAKRSLYWVSYFTTTTTTSTKRAIRSHSRIPQAGVQIFFQGFIFFFVYVLLELLLPARRTLGSLVVETSTTTTTLCHVRTYKARWSFWPDILSFFFVVSFGCI